MKKWKAFLERGDSTILIYLSSVIVIIAMCVVLTNYCMVYIDAENAQIVADVAADGGAAAGDTLWGIDKKKAKTTVKELTEANGAVLDKKDVEVASTAKIKKGKGNSGDEVRVSTTADKTASYTDQTVSAKANAATKVLYSGGRAVVMYAYTFSKNYYEKVHPSRKFKWTRYAWGAGRSIDSDNMPYYADCSGFVYHVFSHFGFDIGTWTGQMQTVGKEIPASEARAGDIVLYYNSGDSISSHVGIYVGEVNGNRMQIDCGGGGPGTTQANTTYNTGVRLRTVSAAAGGRRPQYRRVIKNDGEAYEYDKNVDMFETILFIMKEAGYSDVSVAAAMGIWNGESGLCPIAAEGHFGGYTDPFNVAYANRIKNGQVTKYSFVMDSPMANGYGLAQWTTTDLTNPFGDRKSRLWDFCKKMGTDVTDGYAQVMFVMHELSTTHSGFVPSFKRITDIRQAAEVFMKGFEGILNDSLPARQDAAVRFYNRIKSRS